MSIEYRSSNASEVEEGIKAQRALESEGAAYIQEVEALRLEALTNVVDKDAKPALREAIKEAKETAKTARNKAIRRGSADLPADQIKSARVQFLESWIGSLEQEHIGHVVAISQREASLRETGSFAPTKEEKAGIEARLTESKEALGVIEVAWKVATSEYDKIVPEDSTEE